MSQQGFVFESARCTGCSACGVACGFENQVPPERAWRRVHTFNADRHPALPHFHLSLACNHCAEPACLAACPATAYTKDPATGAVLLDDAACIGCRYCSWACPYDAPRFDAARGVMSKCTFCHGRLAQGLQPACASACPTGALAVAALDPAALPAPELPGLFRGDLGPALRLVGGPPRQAPEAFGAGTDLALLPGPPAEPRKVRAEEEWALLGFTLGGALLAALQVAGALGRGPTVPWWGLPAGGGLLLALSTAHLGRPERAWRAILGWRTSWLSREVLAFGAFLGTATAARLPLPALAPLRPGLMVLAAALGGVLAAAMDRLYQVVERRSPLQLRSGEVVPTLLWWSGLLSGLPALALSGGALKLGLLARERTLAHTLVHGSLGLALPLAAVMVPGLVWPVVWVPLALGWDLLARILFYEGLAIPTPQGLLRAAEAEALGG